MSAKVITIGMEKGGTGKSTTAGTLAYLLAFEHKVLVIDMDAQANVTTLLTGRDASEFSGRSIKEAIEAGSLLNYRIAVSERLHIVAGHPDFASFPIWLRTVYKGIPALALQQALAPVIPEYDYVIIDTPPMLSDFTIGSLAASDYTCAIYETSVYCKAALDRYIAITEEVKHSLNPKLQVAGIVVSLIDSKRADCKALATMAREEYKGLCFETEIRRKAATGRLNINGFVGNHELKKAVEQFIPLHKEVINRCH